VRLRVGNDRFLSLSLALVVGVLVFRTCGVPGNFTSTEPSRATRLFAPAEDAGGSERADGRAAQDPTHALAREVHSIADADAELARIEDDQRQGRRDERTDALEIRALVQLTRVGAAHAKLQHFAERYPDSLELPGLVRLTGYHPRPMARSAR
jgi:hypothetical protein